ncbi:MAG: hypothetical protein M3404_02475 [Actinomycetota bacterium]|nr:hypothetical protein [Actinomycetota bacterium]
MAATRILRNTSAKLEVTFYSDEAGVDPTGSVAVTVTRADGSQVTTGSAVDEAGTGNFSFTLPPQPNLDYLKVDCTASFAGAAQTVTTYAEVVGGFFFSLAEARDSDPALASSTSFSTATLNKYRTQVEDECERICGVAFVPRYKRMRLAGSGSTTLLLPPMTRAVRSVRVYTTATAFTSFTADELADLTYEDSGVVHRRLGRWPAGANNLVVELEHGYDAPPPDVKDKALLRLAYLLTVVRGGIAPDAVNPQVGEAADPEKLYEGAPSFRIPALA